MNIIAQAKSALRRRAQEAVYTLGSDEINKAGIQVAKHIEQWLCSLDLINYKKAGIFKSLKDEISTAPLVTLLEKHGITQSWPYLDNNKVMKFEPACVLDIIFLPGLAFDSFGHRLGRGQGHYDRYLSGLDRRSGRPILVGLCLDEQLFLDLPIEAHDVVMDYICTPKLGVLKANLRVI